MNKKRLNKIYINSVSNLLEIFENHKYTFHSKTLKANYFDDLNNYWDDLIKNKKKIKVGKKGEHELVFIVELSRYTEKLIANGNYFSENFLKALRPYPYNKIDTSSKLFNAFRKNYIPIDTLMGFTILRSWLEEISLNLFFLHKANNHIKTKKWSELFLLIHKINYFGYEKDDKLKIRKQTRNLKKYLNYFLNSQKRLNIMEVIKYVSSQEDLSEKAHNLNLKEIISSEYPNQFKYHLKQQIGKKSYLSMKPLKKFYDKLSNELHPNNFLLRNGLVRSLLNPNELEGKIKISRDLVLLNNCHNYITDISGILFKQTLEMNNFFLSKIRNKDENNRLFLNSFRDSVENKIFKKTKIFSNLIIS
jgi:hypothetical protein|tara:strand:- start:406 stop:1491 length:1086 start_codon:yes stop_codon:yes gene_type:complete